MNPPRPSPFDPARVSLAVAIAGLCFDDQTLKIMALMPTKGIVGDHCRFNQHAGRWEHVMYRHVVPGGRA